VQAARIEAGRRNSKGSKWMRNERNATQRNATQRNATQRIKLDKYASCSAARKTRGLVNSVTHDG
jgi:hypothetical protein